MDEPVIDTSDMRESDRKMLPKRLKALENPRYRATLAVRALQNSTDVELPEQRFIFAALSQIVTDLGASKSVSRMAKARVRNGEYRKFIQLLNIEEEQFFLILGKLELYKKESP